MSRTIYLVISFFVTLSYSQNVSPISRDIMQELRYSYNSGEIDNYIEQVIGGREFTEEQRDQIRREVEYFFDSDQFIETGGQYLTALFPERELEKILAVFRDSSLRSDPNYQGVSKLDSLMKKLKPYIVQYLRHRTK